MGAVRVDVSGAVKTRTALVVSARYISIGVSEFFAFFMTEKTGHKIKCLLTELGRAGRENIWLLVICTDLAALGPYGIPSSQIFSRSALPLSQ